MRSSAPAAVGRSLGKIDFPVDSGLSGSPPKGAVAVVTMRMFQNAPPPAGGNHYRALEGST